MNAVLAVYHLASGTTGVIYSRLMQDASYMLFGATAAVIIAARLNWRNDRQGYWVNGLLVALGDLPFVIFVLIPAAIPLWPGVVGPLLWVAGFMFTTVGRLSARQQHVERTGTSTLG